MSAGNVDAVEWHHALSRIEWIHSCIEALGSAAHSECELLHSNNGNPQFVSQSADRVMIFTSISGEYLSELQLQTKILCERVGKAIRFAGDIGS